LSLVGGGEGRLRSQLLQHIGNGRRREKNKTPRTGKNRKGIGIQTRQMRTVKRKSAMSPIGHGVNHQNGIYKQNGFDNDDSNQFRELQAPSRMCKPVVVAVGGEPRKKKNPGKTKNGGLAQKAKDPISKEKKHRRFVESDAKVTWVTLSQKNNQR